MSALLHVVNLKTDLVSGPVMVGIRPSLPVQVILGNNLAGEKVMVNLCISPNLQLSTGTKEIGLDVPGVFPSCAITHAMAHKSKENEVNSLPNQTHEEHIQYLTGSLAVTQGRWNRSGRPGNCWTKCSKLQPTITIDVI